MVDYILGAFALAVLGAYACRVDGLSWWRTPWLMLLHAAGGIATAWVLHHAAEQTAGGLHALTLAGAVVLLWLTWDHLPGQRARARRHVYHSDLMVSAPLIGHRDHPLDPLDSRDHHRK